MLTPQMALRRLEKLLDDAVLPASERERAEGYLQRLWQHVLQGD